MNITIFVFKMKCRSKVAHCYHSLRHARSVDSSQNGGAHFPHILVYIVITYSVSYAFLVTTQNLILLSEMNKQQNVWNLLTEELKAKRKRPDPRGKGKSRKSGSAPHELIVQRLASEPREFVPFPYEDLMLANLKKTCADHYSLRASLCDVLVINKGPSHTNIEQIPHRKDKVSLCTMHVHNLIYFKPFHLISL